MVRRILAIPLAVVVAIAVFLCPVFSIPINDVSGVIDCYFQTYSGSSFGNPYIYSLPLGSIRSFGFYNYSQASYYGSVNYSSSDSVSFDLYIAVLTASIPNLSFPTLDQYYYPDRNLVDSLSIDAQFTFLSDSEYIFPPTFTTSFQEDITFLCFKGVPSGTDFLVVDNNPAKPNDKGTNGVGVTLEDGNFYPLFTFGYFLTSSYVSVDSVLSDFSSGDIDFSKALDELNFVTDSNVSNSNTTDEKIFNLLLGQSSIERLILLSDDKSLSYIFDNSLRSFDDAIYGYKIGSFSLSGSLEYMSYIFNSSLSHCDSPDQGLLLNSLYQMSLDKLEFESRQKAFEKLDSAVSDDQLSEADDYYQSEEELIDMFEVAEFESALDFQLWFNTLPPSETIEYKKFFDFLLNDSSIRMFLVVPISLILVRILLGTRLVLSRGGHYSAKGDD